MPWMLLALLIAPAMAMGGMPEEPGAAGLARTCPASFELTAGNRCEFRSLYQQYDSPGGFGGLRVPLPPGRDGFSPQQIDLGRLLFFDPALSADGSLSCAHCHHPDFAFADGRGRSVGRGAHGVGPARTGGEELPRGAPSLWNVRFLKRLRWDGEVASLEDQAAEPLFSPREMGNRSREELVRALERIPQYGTLFHQAFPGDPDPPVSIAHLSRALAAFESSLVSLNSRYDRYAHGDSSALSPAEQRGHAIFRSFTVRCSQCHTPPLFSNGELAVIGVPEETGRPLDAGAGANDPDPALRGAFLVPSLRNIALTAPYMHAGQFQTLSEVVRFYNDARGHAVPAGEKLRIHWHIALAGPVLSPGEAADLVAFLGTLTDESMMPVVPERVPSGRPVVPHSMKTAREQVQ